MAALAALPDHELLKRSREALHALNRRAKEKRDRARKFRRSTFSERVSDEIREIYALKNRYLDAVARHGLAAVERFSVRRENQFYECSWCGRSWGARGGNSWCRGCADDTGVLTGEATVSEWFVVDCGDGYRFHQPAGVATETMRSRAIDVEPHEPAQPQREIPDVGLTIDAQRRCVELMIERLGRTGRAGDE